MFNLAKIGRAHLTSAAVAVLLGVGSAYAQVVPSPNPAPPFVSFAPDSATVDYSNLFTQPELWPVARYNLSTFIFSPAMLQHSATPPSFEQMVAANAFRTLRSWGIPAEISVGVIKEWDCGLTKSPGIAIGNVIDIQNAGGWVHFIGMDEPLKGALPAQNGSNNTTCNLTIDQAAAQVASFVKQVGTTLVGQGCPDPIFIDGEPYPYIHLDQHIAYLTALMANGFTPRRYSLDIAMGQVNKNPNGVQLLTSDLKALKAFMDAHGILLDVMIWSSNSPEPTDQAYYNDAMAFTKVIHGILGPVPAVTFASWVYRAPIGSPHGTGVKDVPINLPENDANIYSHTRLINDALAILRAP